MIAPRVALVGEIYHRLTVVETLPGSRRRCICACGHETVTMAHRLRQGRTKSCGCLRREVVAATVEKRRQTILRNGKRRIKCLWSRSWVIAAVEQFKNGRAIARHVGCHKSTVYEALERYGIAVPDSPKTRKQTARKRRDAIELCRRGLSYRFVAAKLGNVDPTTIEAWAREAGIRRSRMDAYRVTRNSELTPQGRERIAAIRRCVELEVCDRMGSRRISQATSIPEGRVKKLLATPYADALRTFVFGPGQGARKDRHAQAMHRQGCNPELIARTVDATLDEVRRWIAAAATAQEVAA